MFRNGWHKVPRCVCVGGVQGDLEMGAFIESLPKKQIDPGFLPQLYSAGNFPSTNQQKPKGLLSEEAEREIPGIRDTRPR